MVARSCSGAGAVLNFVALRDVQLLEPTRAPETAQVRVLFANSMLYDDREI